MKSKNILAVAASALGFGAVGASMAFLNRKYVIYPNEYDKACIYMAALDDEITRMELEGKILNGEKIAFPPRQESLYDKFQFFKETNKHLNRQQLREKVDLLEERYKKAKEEKKQED